MINDQLTWLPFSSAGDLLQRQSFMILKVWSRAGLNRLALFHQGRRLRRRRVAWRWWSRRGRPAIRRWSARHGLRSNAADLRFVWDSRYKHYGCIKSGRVWRKFGRKASGRKSTVTYLRCAASPPWPPRWRRFTSVWVRRRRRWRCCW